jgi:hypothetical protein
VRIGWHSESSLMLRQSLPLCFCHKPARRPDFSRRAGFRYRLRRICWHVLATAAGRRNPVPDTATHGDLVTDIGGITAIAIRDPDPAVIRALDPAVVMPDHKRAVRSSDPQAAVLVDFQSALRQRFKLNGAADVAAHEDGQRLTRDIGRRRLTSGHVTARKQKKR